MSFMLRFLVHLVGDIHMPLHNISRVNKKFPNGDHSGSKFKLLLHSDLHTYWDNLLYEYKNVPNPLTE